MSTNQVAYTADESAYAQAQMRTMLAKSATDATFRSKLLTTPREALAEYVGVPATSIPQSFEVAFVEGHGVPTVVLPEAVDAAAELSDAELETVAGGSEIVAGIITLAVATCELYRALR